MARIERATSPLPRECSTTEPHGHRHGPGLLNGTQARSDLERETGIEPASLAWKAKVLPLNYSRLRSRSPSSFELCFAWWRRLDSNQRRRKPTDLQSAPFSHSGTPPRRTRDYSRVKRQSTSKVAYKAHADQLIERPPWATRKSRSRTKCPQPMNGMGGLRADSGDGWLA